MMDRGRRELLKGAVLAAALHPYGSAEAEAEEKRKLKVVVVGAHPDDPESSCGGTIARYTDLGHDVAVVYLTRGEAGIRGKSASEAAAIRTAEAHKACGILKARPVFAGQIDGRTEINAARYEEFRAILEAEKPDVALIPWPVDSHRDHRVASMLAYDAWERGGGRFELYYSEVDLGGETKNFHPDSYVDISAVVERKRLACLAHDSQDHGGFYAEYHQTMQRFRGLESRCQVAEAFVRASQNPPLYRLPGGSGRRG